MEEDTHSKGLQGVSDGILKLFHLHDLVQEILFMKYSSFILVKIMLHTETQLSPVPGILCGWWLRANVVSRFGPNPDLGFTFRL